MASPWRTQHSDITRGTILSHADLDNNFIFLKGEIIDSARLDGETLKLTKICGADIELSLSTLTQNNEDSLRNIEDDIKANTIWEWGSRGEKSIKVKNGSNNDATGDYSVSEGQNTTASGFGSHAEGVNTTASGGISHSEGLSTNASGGFSHAEGRETTASGKGSHAEGVDTGASGDASHAEGEGTRANGWGSHAEGISAIANGDASHAEGDGTRANGYASHAGGVISQANGDFSFAHTRGKVTFISKADGESSVVLGGTQHVVEGGGENSGVLLGDTNRILGLDYQKLINDTENEIKTLESERKKEHDEFISLESDLKEQLDKKREQIGVLKSEIDELNSEISDLEFKKSELEAVEPRTIEIEIQINEITLVINNLQTLVAQKEKELAALESEASQLKVEIEEATKKENEAQEVYEENRSRLEKLLDEYKRAFDDFDGYLPKQSTILGGSSNIINSASESVIDGGSGNTITPKVKNSGIFGGSKNELGGGTYIDLIIRLKEELSQRAEEKAKYDADTEKLIKSLQSDIADKEKQLQSEKQQQPQDLGLIATLEADIKELKEEKKALEEEVSRNDDTYVAYVKQTDEKIKTYETIEYAKYGEVPSNVITPIDGASLIAGSGNKIIHLSDNSSIVGGKSNLIDNAFGSVILGGEGITATTNNTVYTPNLNIDIQPANDNSLTQVLVRDGDGNVKYKDVSSFTDLSIVSGVYDIRTGIVTFINNDGDSFEISGFTSGMTDSYTTDAYLEDKTIYFNNNIKGDDIYSVDISPILDDVIAAVGYNDRGECSEEQYATYEHEVNNYYTSKETYDEYGSNIQTLTDEITQLNSDIDILKSDLEFKFTDLIYTQITGGSVEELQIIINQKEADLNSKQAELEQKAVERERDIKRQEEIKNSGVLEFAPYVPANEANFNCWSERQIIDSVGYDDRGNCSGDRYEKYLSEYNDVLNYFNTSLAPPAFKDEDILSDTITYNNLSTERQKIIDYWVEFTTYTNNLISSYELEITKYQTILDTLNAIAEPTQSEQDEIDGLVKIITLLEDRKSQLESEYSEEERTYNILIDWFDDNLSYLESTDEYNFIQEYTPINEVNFNCWNDSKDYNNLNTQMSDITSAVGYNDRGSCSEEQYTEYNAYVDSYYTSKEVYDEYESNIKTLTDEITELNSDIDTLKTEINTLERTILLGKLDGIDQTDNQNLKNQKEADLDTKQAELRQKQEDRERDIDRQQQIIDSGALEFAPYVPANEVNFNCWSEQQIIDSVGYDDRGTCDAMSYDTYQRLVQQLKADQSEYNKIIIDRNEATEVRTVENQNFKKEHDVITDNIAFYQGVLNQINQTIEDENRDATPEELAKIAVLEQLIDDLIKNREDLVVAEKEAKKHYEELIAQYNEWIINFENNTKPDIDRYLPENEVNYSCWRNEFFYEGAQSQRDKIISTVGYDDRGSCSEEQYTSYESEVNYYYTSKEEYDEYESNIKTLTDEITDLESSKTTKESELSTKQNELESIKPGSDFIFTNYDNIKSNSDSLTSDVNKLKTEMEFWNYGKTETEFLAEKTSVESLITLSLETWSELNDLMVVNTTFNYQNKEEIINSLTIIKNSLDDIQTILDTMLYTDTEEVFSQNKTDIINSTNSSISSSQKLILDVTLSKDYYEQTNNDLKNDIEQLQQEIDTINANIEQKQEDRERDIKRQEEIIDSGALEFAPYVPANEANFNCWVNAKQTESLTSEINITNNNLTEQVEIINKTINEVVNNVGYDDRGDCSSKLFTEYRALAEQYISTKANYDNLQTSKQGLETDIGMLEEQLATSQSSGEPVDQERIDNLTTEIEKNKNDLAQINKEILGIERSGNLDFAPYVPINEVNFICWVNNIEAVEPSIYNLETHLIDAMDDGRKGTFNYYPNIFDEFTENPTFIIGEFDDLDKIINISDGSRLTWAKAVVKSQWDNGVDMGNPLMDNLEISVNVLERLKSTIISAEDTSQEEYQAIRVNYEDMYAVLELENNTNGTDLDLYELQVKIQNLSNERQNEKEVNEYMVGKITEAIKVYDLIRNIAKDEIENS
jgi:chromosome segregation ATPase